MTLGDVALAIVDCEHKTAPTEPSGFPSIRTTDIKNGRLLLHQANRVSENTYREWTARLEPMPGDLVIAREAPVGEVGIVPAGERVCLGQRTVLVRPDASKVIPKFLLYLLLTSEMRHVMFSRAEGSITPHLNMSDIRALPVPKLPSLCEQQAIAELLGALDDKIELNRLMNETLEGIARAIFKALFVEAAQKQLPSGWRVGTVKDCCSRVENGGTPRRNEPSYWEPGTVPWLTSGEVRQKIVVETQNRISEIGLANSSAKIWPAGTTVVALYGATAGQTTYLADQMCANQACCGLVPIENFEFYVYLHLSQLTENLAGMSRGSAQQNLSQQLIADLPILVPSQGDLTTFSILCHALFQRWIVNLAESKTLASLRDELLPKLISGEIRIKQAEKIVEAHA
jgi:type I restriction enzyme S subunit